MKQAIIIGGGASIREGLRMGLKNEISNRFVIAINYAYRDFSDATFTCFVDKEFYNENREDLANLPLVVGMFWPDLIYLPNTIALKTGGTYHRDIEKEGVYVAGLAGVFALSLAAYLVEDGGDIFLLGYDFGALNDSPVTHYYQDRIRHRGVGNIGHYTMEHLHMDFGPFTALENIHIYNVSLKSHISFFPKVSYPTFFSLLDGNIDNPREEVRKKLSTLSITMFPTFYAQKP